MQSDDLAGRVVATVTPGWANPGAHGASTKCALLDVERTETRCRVTVVRVDDGRRIMIEMDEQDAELFAKKLTESERHDTFR